MPHSVETAHGVAPLTTIDITPFIQRESFTEPHRAEVLRHVKQACLQHGFFIITGHGIPSELQENVLEQSRLFFALPAEEKEQLSEKKSFGKSHRGYQNIRTETLQKDHGPDLKEGFQMGVEKKVDHPHCVAKRMLTGPNVYPPSLEPQFSTIMRDYFQRVGELQEKLLEMVALTLDIDYHESFERFFSDSLRALRLLHYPPQVDETYLGAGAHTDFGGLTCLLTDGVSGLQILHEGSWVDAQTAPGAYIVNLGDMMKRMTAGRYKSSVHRVINTTGKHRYSVPCFLGGNLDFVISPLVEGPTPPADRLTVEEHMMERFGTARDVTGRGIRTGA